MSLKFDCTGCGSCCRRVGDNLAAHQKAGFPYGVKEDGRTCEKLEEDNKCTVYENRPEMCSVEAMYYKVHSKSGKTKKSVFLMEATICNSFIKEDGLDEKFLIDLTQYQ